MSRYLLTHIIFVFGILSVEGQILTSEVKVEQTGDFTTVSGPLEVKAPYTGASQLIVNTTSSSGELRFSDNGVAKGFVWYSPSNNLMAFGRGNWTNSLVVTADGKFGVGTSSPVGQLEVKGAYAGDSQLIINTTASNGELRFSKNGIPKGFVWYNEIGNLMAFGRGGGSNSLFVTEGGSFGFGTSAPSYKLEVSGSIKGTTLHTNTNSWSDFVFDTDYELPTLESVEAFIQSNGHLPEIPSEAEVLANGINLGEMNAKLLQKIEELTLYLIEANKEKEELSQRLTANSQRQEELEARSSKLEVENSSLRQQLKTYSQGQEALRKEMQEIKNLISSPNAKH